MKKYILIALSFFIVNNVIADELVIGVKEAKPFTYLEDGVWKGISIDFIEQLSQEVGFTYTFTENKSLPELIDATKNNKIDMGIAAISLTPERERIVDFSHSYFTTSLGILSQAKSSTSDNIIWIVKQLLLVIIGFIIVLYIVGFIIDIVDGDENIKNPHEGAWWALTTFTTVGYGDLSPATPKGKVLASIWMVASIFLLSLFTAYITSAMTVKNLSETTTTLADLYDVRVEVVAGTTTELRLAELGIEFNTVGSIDEAISNFKSGKNDVVVHDKAMLDYASNDMENVDVWQIDNSDEYYAIAFPTGSKLSEEVNLGILKILSSPKWKAIKINYLGAE